MTSDPRDTDIEADDDLVGGSGEELPDDDDLVSEEMEDDEDLDDGDLDDALEDTFPASDPLPPPSRPGG